MNKPASAPAAALQEASRLASQGRLPQAAQLLRQHLQAQPGDALAWQMLGLMHIMSSQWPDAASALEQSAALNGQDARTWAMLGVACSQQGRVQQAISHFDAAVALAPADAALWCDRGRALHAAQRLEEALASADRALSLNPAQPAAWLLRGNTLRDHAVSYLLAGVLETHERNAFRVIGLDACVKAVPDTPMRQRVLAAFDESIALGRCTPEEAASRIRALRLDVLIDLMGATGDGQAGVPLLRPAPLQVTWLGFPGTSGMDEIDYILADRHVAPPGSEGEFSECIVRLPDTFQPNDSQRAISPAVPTRASQGLPESGFVFCCHNSTYKVLPGMFDIWMRLLHRVPGSVLWLVNDGEHVRANLRAQAARRGIDGGRLVFAERCAYGDYLARYRLADLFLDTLPFNAGTTASDALWAGLPVLTQTGRSFAGRMAASLLHAVGLPELVTQTADEYEALALRLATHAQELAALRQRLNQQGRASALFDTARLTRHLEQALLTMCQRQQQGLPPQGFDVPALPAA